MSSASVDAALPILLPPGRSTNSALPTVMLVGNPNAGKTTLFNRLTGLRAQTANFPGTTVERRRCQVTACGQRVQLVDLPGLYSLEAATPDERVACMAIRGEISGEAPPDLLVLVLDATNLQRNLFLASQALELETPTVVALSMIDVADQHGLDVDADALAAHLGCPVVSTSARTGRGMDALLSTIFQALQEPTAPQPVVAPQACGACGGCRYAQRYEWAESVGSAAASGESIAPGKLTDAIDRLLTHRAVGLLAFAGVMFATFAIIFWIAQYPMGWIDSLFAVVRATFGNWLPSGGWRSLLADGVIGGVGGMLIFLPQICLLFFMLALLEDSGYLARAAFVMDRLMFRVGLPGKAFVPLLSAHACALPAVMATRVIEDRRDRLATILVIPLMTCSARIPVYAMATALAFSHAPLLAAVVLTGAYALGIGAALGTAWFFKKTFLRGKTQPLVIELPNYRRPSLRNALLLTWDRALVFLRSVGTTILAISLILWGLKTYPQSELADLPPDVQNAIERLKSDGDEGGADQLLASAQLENSAIGRLGRAIQPVFAPLGFDWKLSIGVLSSFAAREVLVSTLAVLHGLAEDAAEDDGDTVIARLRAARRADGTPVFGWPTCLSLLTFYALAMQCLPTQAVVRRETGGWKWPLVQLGYMSALAYLAALAVYQTASRFV